MNVRQYLEFKKYTEQKKASSSLTHHGIKGQRWGVRRFQNEDGSLTDAGKERYSVGVKPITNYKEAISAWKDAISNEDEIDYGSWINGREPDKSRGDRVASIGCKALNKVRPGYLDDEDFPEEEQHEWFLFEDQTLGYIGAAQLIDKGYSADDVKRLYQAATKYWDDLDGFSREYSESLMYEAAGEYYFNSKGMNDYIDACYKFKQKES